MLNLLKKELTQFALIIYFFKFKGPKLFKRLTGKSNKLTIINSLTQRVLAGTVNAAVRKQVIDVIRAKLNQFWKLNILFNN